MFALKTFAETIWLSKYASRTRCLTLLGVLSGQRTNFGLGCLRSAKTAIPFYPVRNSDRTIRVLEIRINL